MSIKASPSEWQNNVPAFNFSLLFYLYFLFLLYNTLVQWQALIMFWYHVFRLILVVNCKHGCHSVVWSLVWLWGCCDNSVPFFLNIFLAETLYNKAISLYWCIVNRAPHPTNQKEKGLLFFLKKLTSGGKTAPIWHCIKKKPQSSWPRKPPKPGSGPHCNLGRPWPTMLATTATIPPGRSTQTNHRCHMAGALPMFFCVASEFFIYLFATTRIWTLVGVFLNWEAYHYTTGVLADCCFYICNFLSPGLQMSGLIS